MAVGAGFPLAFASFIAADVDVVRWEKVDNLGEHILKELESGFLAGAEVAALARTVARHLGISSQNFFAVARHLNFGDYSDVASLGVSQDFADIVLGIETAVGARVSLFAVLVTAVAPLLPSLGRTPCSERS